MNKFGFFAIALVVASACVVSAAPNVGLEGKLHGHKLHGSKHVAPIEHEQEVDYEVQHEPIQHGAKHVYREPIRHQQQECHCPEYQHREPIHVQEQTFHVPKHFNKHGHQGQGYQQGFKGRSGSASSVSGDLERSRGSLRGHEDERDSVHAEGHKSGSKLAAKGVIAGAANKNHNEDIALKKHQKINNDKTVIVDKSSGSNDVELNRHVNDNKQAGGFAAGVVGAKAGSASGRFDAERDNERDFEASNSRFRERDGVESQDF